MTVITQTHTHTHCFRLSCTLLLLLMLSFSRFFFFLPILLLIFLLFPSLFFLLHPSFLSLSSSLLFVFFCFYCSSILFFYIFCFGYRDKKRDEDHLRFTVEMVDLFVVLQFRNQGRLLFSLYYLLSWVWTLCCTLI